MLHCHHLLSPFSPLAPPSPTRPHLLLTPIPLPSSPPPHCLRSSSAGRKPICASGLQPLLADLSEAASTLPQVTGEGGGPIELPFSSPTPLFAVDDNPSTLQVATSVLLTGAITVFLFRSLRRRARRAKELRVRSTGMGKPKDLKKEALDSLKAMGVASVEAGAPPSPVQAMLGGIAAGVIAILLYKFASTVEASLNRQTISDNFSVRQITITIRTIVNGLCYLATFVFGINSVGLILYSIQLAVNSLIGSPTENSSSAQQDDGPVNVTTNSGKNSTESLDSRSSDMQESSDDR